MKGTICMWAKEVVKSAGAPENKEEKVTGGGLHVSAFTNTELYPICALPPPLYD